MGHHHHSHDDHHLIPLLGQKKDNQLTCARTLIVAIILIVGIVTWRSWMIPNAPVSLRHFVLSDLLITHHQISGYWQIGLNLHNRANQTARYTDISYILVYSGDSTSQPVLDAHKQYTDGLILGPDKKTMVFLQDTVKNLDFNRAALSNMKSDVIWGKVIDFDLVAKVTVVAGDGDEKKVYMMNCVGIEVKVPFDKIEV